VPQADLNATYSLSLLMGWKPANGLVRQSMAAVANTLLQGRVGQRMDGGDSPGGLTLGGGL
jgi:hypothetical protein